MERSSQAQGIFSVRGFTSKQGEGENSQKIRSVGIVGREDRVMQVVLELRPPNCLFILPRCNCRYNPDHPFYSQLIPRTTITNRITHTSRALQSSLTTPHHTHTSPNITLSTSTSTSDYNPACIRHTLLQYPRVRISSPPFKPSTQLTSTNSRKITPQVNTHCFQSYIHVKPIKPNEPQKCTIVIHTILETHFPSLHFTSWKCKVRKSPQRPSDEITPAINI